MKGGLTISLRRETRASFRGFKGLVNSCLIAVDASPSWSSLQLLPGWTSPGSLYTTMQPWTSLAACPVIELQSVAPPNKLDRIGT